ncbi:MAG: hypothetical protein AAF772_18935 [Acidobacteriota bacterium]
MVTIGSGLHAATSADVVILGGGVAGYALALALRAAETDGHASTATVDAPTPRRRARRIVVVASGAQIRRLRVDDALPDAAATLLRRLGLDPADYRPIDDGSAVRVTHAAWSLPQLTSHVFDFGVPDAHRARPIARRRLLDALEARARAVGIHVWTDTRLRTAVASGSGAQAIPDDWRLVLEQPHGDVHVRARFVVDATGRRMRFAQMQGAQRLRDDHAVIAWRALPRADVATLARLPPIVAEGDDGRGRPPGARWIEAVPTGWWASAPAVEDPDRLVIAQLTDADQLRTGDGDPRLAARQWRSALRATIYTCARWRRTRDADGDHASAPVRIADASVGRLDRLSGPRWLAVGSAAATFDPLAASGLFEALRGGLLAADAVRAHLAGAPDALARYAHAVGARHEQHVRTRALIYGAVTRFASCRFWSRRIAADAVASPTPAPRPPAAQPVPVVFSAGSWSGIVAPGS